MIVFYFRKRQRSVGFPTSLYKLVLSLPKYPGDDQILPKIIGFLYKNCILNN